MKNPFYVYALKDPTNNPALIFYIGKGTGDRAWEHEKHIDNSEKGQVIKAIHDAGKNVIHTILVSNLTETQALKIEAELISTFGVRSEGGFLTNKVKPSTRKKKLDDPLNLPDGCYEKSQIALQMLKESVLEFASANPEGVTNADVAKYLGLQTSYGGGSKDYLSYSILGLLMREGDVKRGEKKGRSVKHVAINNRFRQDAH